MGELVSIIAIDYNYVVCLLPFQSLLDSTYEDAIAHSLFLPSIKRAKAIAILSQQLLTQNP